MKRINCTLSLVGVNLCLGFGSPCRIFNFISSVANEKQNITFKHFYLRQCQRKKTTLESPSVVLISQLQRCICRLSRELEEEVTKNSELSCPAIVILSLRTLIEVCVRVCVSVQACVSLNSWWPEDTWKAVLRFHHVAPQNRTQVIRLGGMQLTFRPISRYDQFFLPEEQLQKSLRLFNMAQNICSTFQDIQLVLKFQWELKFFFFAEARLSDITLVQHI